MFRGIARRLSRDAYLRQDLTTRWSNPGQIHIRMFYKFAYNMAKKVLPRMSDTERAALESGTVGFDREIFSGSPSLDSLEKYSAKLSQKELSFLNSKVHELCEMLDDYAITIDGDLPPEVWDFIKKNGFLGMIIPEKYGGIELSPHGHSQVITKVSSRSISAAVSISVPNSLGPAELLLRYGTEHQKDYFLPKLANGSLLPCFALTGPSSGSDAASMRDTGVVCRQDGVLGIRASFNKRYITLSPIATCVGIAVNVSDPQDLLAGIGHAGITVALLERSHPGLHMGKRHDPLSIAFMNGPVTGEDVFIPMNCIIGGQARVGFGWNMLMDCLSEGRSISLPASAVAASKLCFNAVGGYARIRKQFKVPIATMEGVQEHLATIAHNTLTTTSAQYLVNSMLNQKEQPTVLSGVSKQQITHLGRESVTNAMDVLGGAGICKGPSNFMANTYQGMPVAITVEGANTLTRSLIIYGQGLVRAHPHLFDVIQTIQSGNDLAGFKKELNSLIGHFGSNVVRSQTFAVTRRRRGEMTAKYESQLQRLAANFAVSADLSLLLGRKLKFTEMISGRFADVFSNIYLGYATLWMYKEHQQVEGMAKLVDYTMTKLIWDTQETLRGVFKNFPVPGVGTAMRVLTFPYGFPYECPTDKQVKDVAEVMSTSTGARALLSDNMFISKNVKHDRVAMINNALPIVEKADEILTRVRRENRDPNDAEKSVVSQAERWREMIIQVDSFDKLGVERHQADDYVRPALRHSHKGSFATSHASKVVKT